MSFHFLLLFESPAPADFCDFFLAPQALQEVPEPRQQKDYAGKLQQRAGAREAAEQSAGVAGERARGALLD